MKKHSDYRLIKEYPGSYKVGYVLKALNRYEAGKYWINNNWFNPEEFPEYWEIVKDEIKVGDYIWRIWPSGKKTLGIACGFSDYKCDYKNTLLSFTHFWSLENYSSEGGVRKNEGYGKGDDEDDYKYELATDSEINKYLESIKPIFTTEDGVEMFEGNKYYAVYSTWLCDAFNVSKFSPLSHTKNFSSRELANKYISENKPQFSKKDMMNFHNCSEVCFDLWYSKYKK